MQVFKTTLAIVLRSPLYLLLYIVFFGFLGVIIVSSTADTLSSDAATDIDRAGHKPLVSVIDRDQSEVSIALEEFLSERATMVELEDNAKALQDATAVNLASYILIIPSGFGESFIDAARADTSLPQLNTIVNYSESDGILMNLITNEFLGALRISAIGAPEASTASLLDTAVGAAAEQVSVEAIPIEDSLGLNARVVFYFQWIAYPITTGLIVLTAIIFATFQSGELRRRNLCSPLSPGAMNLQVALGCTSLVFMTWAFLMLLSLLPQSGGLNVLTTDPLAFALTALAALVYAFVPFSLGFLLSQTALKETAINGAANILGLSFCFLSGVFMGGTNMLGEGIQKISSFIPTTWYSEAVIALQQGSSNSDALYTYAINIGVVALFAVALFSVALVVGRLRMQSADAGGNPAAEASY